MTTPDATADRARTAARGYARRHGYTPTEQSLIDAPPVLGPVTFDRDGTPVTAYRWMGAGRGATYVQVELTPTHLLIRGARGDAELPTETTTT
jgi:hypothetical protein